MNDSGAIWDITHNPVYRLLSYYKEMPEGDIVRHINAWWFEVDGHKMFEEAKRSGLIEQTGKYGGWQLVERYAREIKMVPSVPSTPSSKGVKKRRRRYRCSRKGLLEQVALRDGLECASCGKKFSSKRDKDLTLHHKIPISLDGKPTTILNLQILCSECHRKKEPGYPLPPDPQHQQEKGANPSL